jgi:hypothetical protein
MAPWLERLPNKPSWRIGFYLLWTASVLVQLPGLAVDFDLWQNRLLETGLPLFAPPTFFLPTYSPLLGTWQYINPVNLDIAWMHNSQIDWLLLGSLLLNIGLSGWLLLKQFRQPTEQTMRPIDYLAGLLALLVTGLLLFQAHQSQPPGLMTAMAEVNRTPAPLIYNEPELAVPLAERYRGHQLVLGLFTPEPARLAEFTAAAPAVWWLGSDGSGIEAQLLADYAVARQDTYGEQALWLFARSDGPAQPVEAQFGDITLKTVRLSSTPRAQAPLAVELIWEAEQTPASNYQVFLHLLNANGETVAQADGQPVHWTRPTTTWQPAETISDRYALWLPALPPGPYTLIAGLYQPENGQRLTTSANQDAVQLATFTLQ